MYYQLPVSLTGVNCVGLGVESVLLSLDLFEKATPLAAFRHAIQHLAGPIHQSPYLIWGGLAANLLLMVVGRTNTFYSLHDIELLRIVNGRTARHPTFLRNIRIRLSTSTSVDLSIGGSSLPEKCYGLTVAEFQSQRIMLSDGDLYLNNIAVLVTPAFDQIEIICPQNMLKILLSRNASVDVKPLIDLQCAERLARRITRSIAKATRFWRIAKLPASSNLYRAQEELVAKFFFLAENQNESESAYASKDGMWFQVVEIRSSIDAGCWLFRQTFSEIVKRLAGVEGVSSSDRDGFMAFVSDFADSSRWAVNAPLLQELAEQIASITGIWPVVNKLLFATCYEDFLNYQPRNAHLLVYEFSGAPL